ncbi:phage gp6-like head-tail connector protein [Streptomyces sp. NPDC006997]|uniref:phage gp6-like head-tail connector protein n=1 Tax=Streptomyces sp. NPDC006997 TaxID=3155356 RepID=UPI0034110CD9
MAGEYVTGAELKEQLGIEADDTTRDARADRAVRAASRAIDRATGRLGRGFWLDDAPTARTYQMDGRTVRSRTGDLLLVDEIGDTTGMLVETGSGTSWSPITGYETQPDNALADGRPVTGLLRPGGTWGLASSRVRVTARFGWPSVPDDIAEAAMIQASRLFKRADSPEGVMGSSEWGVVRLSRRDPDVWALIEPYILHAFG